MTDKETELLALTLYVNKLHAAVYKLNVNAAWIDDKIRKHLKSNLDKDSKS